MAQSLGAQKMRKRDMDMTQGSIWKQILVFAVPLMVGNLFQQFYNTVDSIVVGNFVGKEALAAVGSVGPIINSLIGFFMGLSTGAGVVISQSYGAQDYKKVSRTVHTTFVMTLILCVLFTVVGTLMIPFMLRLMSTPEDVFGEASTYLGIYFAGVTGLLIYNMGSGILRAVGDSKRPLYFLIFSAAVNTVLDIYFVAVLKWGIAGAAWATVIAQILSAVLVLLVLARSDGPYRLRLKKLCLEIPILREIVGVGFPAALQQMITSFSNVFVQSYINSFGSSAMAGWSAYSKIDQVIFLPMQSVSLATTTFVGQNYGARQPERMRKGTKAALCLAAGFTVTMASIIYIIAPFAVELFNQEPAVIEYGTFFLRIAAPFYVCCSVNQVYASSLRGMGDSRAPMVIMLSSFVVFRQIYLFTVSRIFGTITPVALGYPMGWMVCSASIYWYYRRKWKRLEVNGL